MTLNEIREKYLKFYAERGHVIIPSAKLTPENDATTLFTGSGMQPLVPYLLGQPHPEGKRLADSQKSFRAEDIEEVGDNRHTTFFEMLGNWSLGDYFKAEQLPWIFEFLTSELGLDPNKLYVTVFAGDPENNVPRDDESVAIWQKLFADKGIEAKDIEMITEEHAAEVGMQGGRIFYYRNKNWWSRAGAPENMPVGEPGGPDSEIFYEFSEVEHDPKFGTHCHPNCDCGRYLEIGNSVFMEYQKTDNGFERLSQQNVDFGGGLERMTAATINSPDVFKIDIFQQIISHIESTSQASYSDPASKPAFRVIADHLRASVFLLGDGVLPANKEAGYVLRRLIRRLYLKAKKLNLSQESLVDVISMLCQSYAQAYPELTKQQSAITDAFIAEIKKFDVSLEKGLREFEKLMASQKSVSGSDAFDLYQNYGFPWELTKEMAEQAGQIFDAKLREEFVKEFEHHRELSRTASAGMFKGGLASHSDKIIRLHTATHLMNAALRKVLGSEVYQKGSNITEDRTRFDFTYNQKMTDEQKAEVESLVNDWISRGLEVKQETMPESEARSLGAIGVFGEKYPETVSVYTVWEPASGEVVSREFCGGPHVTNTSLIGKFKINKEEASSAGIRRIKATIE